MRGRRFVVGVVAAVGSAGLLIVACGDDPVASVPVTDAGDASDGATTVDSAVPDAGCDQSQSLFVDLPDGSVFDGATSTGACFGCFADKCQDTLRLCGKDCECRAYASKVFETCAAVPTTAFGLCDQSVAEDAGMPPVAKQGLISAVFSCGGHNCFDACGFANFIPDDGGDGTDAGPDGDAGPDAGADADP